MPEGRVVCSHVRTSSARSSSCSYEQLSATLTAVACCLPTYLHTTCSVPAKTAVPSADGTKLAAVTEEGVAVYETATGAKVAS